MSACGNRTTDLRCNTAAGGERIHLPSCPPHTSASWDPRSVQGEPWRNVNGSFLWLNLLWAFVWLHRRWPLTPQENKQSAFNQAEHGNWSKLMNIQQQKRSFLCFGNMKITDKKETASLSKILNPSRRSVMWPETGNLLRAAPSLLHSCRQTFFRARSFKINWIKRVVISSQRINSLFMSSFQKKFPF